LGIFCLGLWASALIPLMLRGFFALQDTKTPTLIAVLTVLLNVGLSFSFVSLLGTNSRLWFWLVKTFNLGTIYDIRILGLVLAFSASAIFQFILCLMLFKKKNEKT
jgi:putative peptidoglycan lipid II flippase